MQNINSAQYGFQEAGAEADLMSYNADSRSSFDALLTVTQTKKIEPSDL